MLTDDILLKSFPKKKIKNDIQKKLKLVLKENNELFKSMSRDYVDSYNLKDIKKIKSKNSIRLIGMGGSILGSQAIYNFLKKKINKKFDFIDNLNPQKKNSKDKFTNFIISKSGNTLETISNTNIYIKKKDKNCLLYHI